MSGAAPPTGRIGGILVCVAALLVLPSVQAVPLQADLAFDGAPTLSGAGHWEANQALLDLQAADGVPPFRLDVEAATITVTTRTWDHRIIDVPPLYGDDSEGEHTIGSRTFRDADLALHALRPSGRAVLSSTDWDLAADFDTARLHAVRDIWATADPGENDYHDGTIGADDHDGTIRSSTVHLEDQILLVPTKLDYTATGDFQMTLYEGDITVREGSETTRYRSGEWQEDRHVTIGDTARTSVRQLLIITFEDAILTGHWGQPALLSATAPRLTLDGLLEIPSARGDLVVDRLGVFPHEQPVAATGTFHLRPSVDTSAVVPDHCRGCAPIVYYAGGQMQATGDADTVTLAAAPVENPFSHDRSLVAAGATGLGLMAALYAAWRWGPFAFWAMYSRLERGALLENPTRSQIYDIVCANPGISARQVHDLADASWGTVVHHLTKLEEGGYVAVRANGRAKSYYENHGKWDGHQEHLALLARDKTRRIAEAIQRVPGRDQTQIMQRTGLPQSTVSYHLLKLEKKGLVTKDRVGQNLVYYPTATLRALSERLGLTAQPRAGPIGGAA